MTSEEEQTKIPEINSDIISRDKLIEDHLRLVSSIAIKYAHCGMPLEDLVSEGYIGLIKAIDYYDPKKNVKFSTYASFWIRRSILNALLDQKSLIHLPQYSHRIILKAIHITEKFQQEYGHAPTTQEILDRLHLPNKLQNHQILLKYNQLKYIASLESIKNAEQLFSKATLSENEQYLIAQLHVCVKELEWRQQEILNKHFGMNGEDAQPLRALAKDLNLSFERVRQLYHLAIENLREKFRNRQLL